MWYTLGIRVTGAVFYFHFFGVAYSLILVYILAAKTYITFIYHIVTDFRCLTGSRKEKSHRTMHVRFKMQLSLNQKLQYNFATKNKNYLLRSVGTSKSNFPTNRIQKLGTCSSHHGFSIRSNNSHHRSPLRIHNYSRSIHANPTFSRVR